MNRISTILFFLLISKFSEGQDQKFVEDFKLKDAVEGKGYSLSSFDNSKAVVVIFNSTECPYSLYYDSRIKMLAEKYMPKNIAFVMINSNFGRAVSAENLSAMKSQGRLYNFPYLADPAQDAMSKFGARKNPEVFLLKPANGKFQIFYSGAIDDNPQVESDVKIHYAENAIEQLLSGKHANPAYVNPAGCVIKK